MRTAWFEMLTLHFSQVWSLGGVAKALEVGKEAWELSELGTKAGVPPLSSASKASCKSRKELDCLGAARPWRFSCSILNTSESSSRSKLNLGLEGRPGEWSSTLTAESLGLLWPACWLVGWPG